MSSLDVSKLTPADAVAALRSYPRRYRSELAQLPGTDTSSDVSIDELAGRPGPGGTSALEEVSDVTRTWALVAQTLRQTLFEDGAVAHPAVADASQRHWDTPAPASVAEAIELLEHEADELVGLVGQAATASDWNRTAEVPGGQPLSALQQLQEAVLVGADGLTELQHTLAAVRG